MNHEREAAIAMAAAFRDPGNGILPDQELAGSESDTVSSVDLLQSQKAVAALEPSLPDTGT